MLKLKSECYVFCALVFWRWTPISIDLRTDIMRFQAKRCGVQFSPPSIILIYQQLDTNKVRKRIIPVRNFSKYSGKEVTMFNLYTSLYFVVVCKQRSTRYTKFPDWHQSAAAFQYKHAWLLIMINKTYSAIRDRNGIACFKWDH